MQCFEIVVEDPAEGLVKLMDIENIKYYLKNEKTLHDELKATNFVIRDAKFIKDHHFTRKTLKDVASKYKWTKQNTLRV